MKPALAAVTAAGTALIGLLPAVALAAQTRPAPADFAFGFPVDAHGQGPVWELVLPEAVHRRAVRADLGDVRVFNGAGDIVPHALAPPALEDIPPPEPVALPFFPLRGSADSARATSLRITTDERGAVIEAQSGQDGPGGGERVTAWLVDASRLPRAPERLVLDWSAPTGPGFSATVAVETSDDLARWRTLVAEATLADLQATSSPRVGEAPGSGSVGARFIHRDIPLPPGAGRYLRISWPEPVAAVTPVRVTAEVPAVRRAPQRRWLQVEPRPPEGGEPGFRYDTGGHFPVDRARVRFGETNAVLHATLASRPDDTSPWRPRHTGLFYGLGHSGAGVQADAVELTVTSDPRWRLTPVQAGSALPAAAPVLELGWLPRRLTFVAQGGPPYVLAFGSATAGPAASPLDDLLRTLGRDRARDLVVEARAGELVTLGGEARLTPPAPPLPWKTWALWAVLGAGLLVLAWMVRRLLGELGQGR